MLFKYRKIIVFIALICFFTIMQRPKNTMDVKEIQGNEKLYYGSEDTDLTTLNDTLFQNSEYLYNQDLAMKSFFLATAAFSADEADKFWGDEGDFDREKNIKNTLYDYGYSGLEFYGYDKSLNDTSSKTAFAIGKKIYNSDTVIIAIAVRGGNYGLEWADNFNLGSSEFDYHYGFYSSALKTKKQTDEYIRKNVSDKKIKLWITGYSRGGAVANILSSMYDNQKSDMLCEVYAYTFASPRCAVADSLNIHDDIYNNIFNILSPYDPVYNIPPEKWGFGRFGVSVYFPQNPKDETLNMVKQSYFKYTGSELNMSKNPLNVFLDIIIKSAKSRDLYSKYLSVPASDFMIVNMSKYKSESGRWVNYDPRDILSKMYGLSALKTLDSIKSNEFFKSIEKLGLYVPEDIYIFLTLCTLNGYVGFEEEIFSNLRVNDISYITSSDFISVCHNPIFYRSWLENTPINELSFEKG